MRDGQFSQAALPAQVGAAGLSTVAVARVADDRDTLEPADAALLIVEDDPHYARVLCDLAHDTGFKVWWP